MTQLQSIEVKSLKVTNLKIKRAEEKVNKLQRYLKILILGEAILIQIVPKYLKYLMILFNLVHHMMIRLINQQNKLKLKK